MKRMTCEKAKGGSGLLPTNSEDAMNVDNRMAPSPKRDKKKAEMTEEQRKETIILRYPMVGVKSQEIDGAIACLQMLSGKDSSVTGDQNVCTNSPHLGSKVLLKQDYCIIKVGDHERLAPGKWLNYELINFYLQW